MSLEAFFLMIVRFNWQVEQWKMFVESWESILEQEGRDTADHEQVLLSHPAVRVERLIERFHANKGW